MIVTIFGIIIFQLAERIAIKKSSTKVNVCNHMLGFSYVAISTRHAVPQKPYLQEIPILLIRNP